MINEKQAQTYLAELVSRMDTTAREHPEVELVQELNSIIHILFEAQKAIKDPILLKYIQSVLMLLLRPDIEILTNISDVLCLTGLHQNVELGVYKYIQRKSAEMED